jgi:hypothetical protein
MDKSSKKIIKPFFNARLANRMQACAKELNEQAQGFAKEQEEKTKSLLEGMVGSTFHRVKTKSVMRREANQAKRKAFLESLSIMIATAAYNAMPMDNKKKLNENATLAEQPKVFMNLLTISEDLVSKDPVTSMIVGDKYARVSMLDIGSREKLNASQLAVAIASSMSPVREPVENSLVVQNFVDTLTTFGPDIDGQERQFGNLAEGLYETFVQRLAEDVERKVIASMKIEAEKAELQEFLHESYTEDKYAERSNRNLARVAKAPSVFREVYKTVAMKAGMEDYTQDMILEESIAQYTLLETLNSLELLGKTKEQIIDECIAKRRKLVK